MNAKEFIALMDSKHGESWSNSTEELAEAMEIYAKQYASQMPSEEVIFTAGYHAGAEAKLMFPSIAYHKWLKSLQQENQTEE